VYACVTALVVMQDTPHKSWELGKQRLIATAIAGLITMAFLVPLSLLTDWQINGWLAPLLILLSFMVCNRSGHKEMCSACGVAILALTSVTGTGMDVILSALRRLIETGAGTLIAVGINRAILPRREEVSIYVPASEKRAVPWTLKAKPSLPERKAPYGDLRPELPPVQETKEETGAAPVPQGEDNDAAVPYEPVGGQCPHEEHEGQLTQEQSGEMESRVADEKLEPPSLSAETKPEKPQAPSESNDSYRLS
ncbi:MAG: FUSC family protein, partial [Clostridiales bacterium]|nr:FUSC family protein [Clostridiales bacterium]